MAFPFGTGPQHNSTPTVPIADSQQPAGAQTGLAAMHQPEYLAFLTQQAAFFNPSLASLNPASNQIAHGAAAAPNLAAGVTHIRQPVHHPTPIPADNSDFGLVSIKHPRLGQGFQLGELAFAIQEIATNQQQMNQQVHDLDIKLSAINQRIEELELASAATGSADTSLESIDVPAGTTVHKKKERKVQNTQLQNAVRAAGSALMGISRQRVPDSPYPRLILPDPLREGEPRRTDPAGHRLWNPNWLSNTPYTDPTNVSFMQAVVQTTMVNAQAPGSVHPLEQSVSQYQPIMEYTKQYLKTLIRRYKVQVDPAAKLAFEKKKDQARNYNRKSGKLHRRLEAVQAFHHKYAEYDVNLDNLDIFRREYMSSDDDGPDEDEEGFEEWSDHCAKYMSRVSSAVMVVPKKWRAFQLSRIFYALDEIAFSGSATGPSSTGQRTILTRVHALEMFADWTAPPTKGRRTPRFLVNPSWIAKDLHQVIMDEHDPPAWWSQLEIPDKDLHPNDVEALTNWAKEEVEMGMDDN